MSQNSFHIEYAVDLKQETLKLSFRQDKKSCEVKLNCKPICILDCLQNYREFNDDDEYGHFISDYLPECSGNCLVLSIDRKWGNNETLYVLELSSRQTVKDKKTGKESFEFTDYDSFEVDDWHELQQEFLRVWNEISQKYPTLGRPLKEFREEQERERKKDFEELEKYIMSNRNEKPKGKAVLYKKPTGKNASIYCAEREDVNGKTIWINWNKWLGAIKIDSPKNLKKLPKELLKYVDKWEQAFLKRKEEDFYLNYPIKLVSIHFIYQDNIYKMTPDAFKNATNDYFCAESDTIEKDLQDAGCIYTFYNDFLD